MDETDLPVPEKALRGVLLRYPALHVEAFFLSRAARLTAALISFGAGFLCSAAFGYFTVWAFAGIAVLATSLAVSVGLGKTTTACGLNVLGYLTGTSEPHPLSLRDATSYVVASTLTAGVIGGAIGLIGDVTRLNNWPVAAVPVLALLGLLELGLIRARFIPSLRWQVPGSWVRGRPAAPLIWGILLGSGISTWMPFPSYFGLLVLAAVMPFPAGVLLMGCYGLGRALPALGVVKIGPRLVERITDRMWQLRLTSHAVAGCLTLALCGAIVGAMI